MSEKTPSGPDEQHEKPILEIWVVDDENLLRATITMLVSRILTDSRCVGFAKAEDAMTELQKRTSEKTPLPAGIFMDGTLGGDNPEFNRGPIVVQKIRSMQQADDTFIVAFSGESDMNEAMMENGADVALKKPASRDEIHEVLQKIKTAHEKK